jgi:hypothetical protein
LKRSLRREHENILYIKKNYVWQFAAGIIKVYKVLYTTVKLGLTHGLSWPNPQPAPETDTIKQVKIKLFSLAWKGKIINNVVRCLNGERIHKFNVIIIFFWRINTILISLGLFCSCSRFNHSRNWNSECQHQFHYSGFLKCNKKNWMMSYINEN